MKRWRQPSPFGDITVVTTERGLHEICLDADGHGHTARALADRVVERQLGEWFAGKRRSFDLDLDLEGFDGFPRAVLETLVREVGWGETVTYGELAAMAGRPRAARAVGNAMHNNPILFVIPCHRVVAAGNRIGGYGDIAIKRELLAREGVTTLR